MALPPLPERDKLDVAQKVTKGVAGAIPLAGGVVAEIFDAVCPAPVEGKRDEWLRRLAHEVEDRPTRQELAEDYGLRPELARPPSQSQRIDPDRRDAVIGLFGAASQALLEWPQVTDGHWIERPEVERINQLLSNRDTKLVSLLGEPGSGKSAILARATCDLRDRGAVYLAIKADLIPATVTSLDDLSRLWGLSESVSTLLLKLASETPIIVLIDQLDALGELMDTKTERFAVLQSLIDQLWVSDNIKIVVSSRSFDAEYDVRLRSIFGRRGCERVLLQVPEWTAIEPLMEAKGFKTQEWPVCVKEVLRAPQHLKLFLAHWSKDSSQPAFATYTALLETVIVERVGRPFSQAINALYAIAEQIGETEELWIPTARVDAEFPSEIVQLQEAGLLVARDSGHRISFQHQTLFSFIRARSFVAKQRSLYEFTRRHQESLSMRSTLWSAMNYLRDADPQKYAIEMRSILTDPQIRPHVKLLIISFLGSKAVANPSAEEASWILPLLRQDALIRPHILTAFRGKSTWLQVMKPGLLTEELMGRDAANAVAFFLRDTLAIDREFTLSFIERSWAQRADCDEAICSTLYDLKDWDDRSFGIISPVLRRNQLQDFFVIHLAESMVRHRPDLAARLLKEQLEGALDRALNAVVTRTVSDQQTDIESCFAQENARAPIKHLVDDQHAWYGIEAIASAGPREFVETLWPWIVKLSELVADEPRTDALRYRPDYAWRFGERFCSHLSAALWQAMSLFAEQHTAEFLTFAKKARQADTMAVHRLLVRGFEKVAPSNGSEVIGYLVEDPRRLAVSESGYDIEDSRNLLELVGPAASDNELDLLVTVIESWAFWIEPCDESRRASREEQNRADRLNLLAALPRTRLPSRLATQLESFSSTRSRDRSEVFGGVVRSPVPAAQFAESTDKESLSILSEYPDSRERGPTFLEGGSLEVAHEFAEFAKSNPAKATAIVGQLRASDQTLAAGYALEAIAADNTLPAEQSLNLARELAARGFTHAEEFRYSFARALESVARRLDGLPDQDCRVLESLLVDAHPATPQLLGEELPRASKDDGSILWDARGGVQPHGNYPILQTLAISLLVRKPPAADRFLEILERHLGRRDDLDVWQSLLRFVPYLANADRTRSRTFTRNLFSAYPALFETVDGVRFMANVHVWIGDEVVLHFIQSLERSAWPPARQALGEFAALRVALAPNDTAASTVVESALTGDADASLNKLALGVALSAAETWVNPRFRVTSHRILMTMIGKGGAVGRASLRAFSGEDGERLPNDGQTAALLAAMAEHPDLLRDHSAHSILIRLRELLEDGFAPAAAARLGRAVLEASGNTVGDFRTAGPMLVKDLAALSDTRTDGTWMFERLLLDSAYEIDGFASQIDRRF
jgi:hypothetical protein